MIEPDNDPPPRQLKDPTKGVRGLCPLIPLSADDKKLLVDVLRAATANPTFCYEFLKAAASFAGSNKHRRAVLTVEMKNQAVKAKMTPGRAPIPDEVCIGLAIAYARKRKSGVSADKARELVHSEYPEYKIDHIEDLVERGNQLHRRWRVDMDAFNEMYPEAISWQIEV